MAIYTNTMRMTGLSGIDTEAMVTAMMKAESMKYTRLQKKTQTLQWQQTAYRGVASSLLAFQSKFLDISLSTSARLSTSYKTNTATVSSSAVKVNSSTGAKVGTYKLEVSQLADKDAFSGSTIQGKIETGEFDARKIEAGDKFRFTLDGVARDITFSEDDIQKIQNSFVAPNKAFENLLNEKLGATFGQDTVTGGGTENKIQAKLVGGNKLEFTTTAGHSLKISEAASRSSVSSADSTLNLGNSGQVSKYGLAIEYKGDIYDIEFELTAGMTNSAIAKSINDKLKEKEMTNLTASVEDGKIVFKASGTTESITITSMTNTDYSGDSLRRLGFGSDSDSNGITLGRTSMIAGIGLTAAASTDLNLSGTKLVDFISARGADIDDYLFEDTTEPDNPNNGKITFKINETTFYFDKDTSLSSMMNQINNSGAGVTISYDGLKGNFKLEGKNTGERNGITLSDGRVGDDADAVRGFFADVFNLDVKDANQRTNTAKDALFTFNGVTTSRESNNIELNGLKLTLMEKSTDTIDIVVSKDIDTTFSFIKDFVEAYNSMIESIRSPLTTSRPRSGKYDYYDPLSDEEKEAMSDKQIEQWEEKAQKGLLYNDSILKKISDSFRSMLYDPVDLGDGKKISLYEIGITTSSNYNDGGKLVIDEDKLRAALENRGEDVAALFTKSASISYKSGTSNSARLKEEGIADRMNDIINMAIDSRGSITQKAGIETNSLSMMDNSIQKMLKDHATKLSDMLDYLADKETYYYSMFSKMEQAINSSNTQMSYLQSQLGM